MSPEGPAFEVQVDGFSHKLPVLTTAIFAKLASFQVRPHCMPDQPCDQGLGIPQDAIMLCTC